MGVLKLKERKFSYRKTSELYIELYPKNPKTVRISEFDVPLPKKPPRREMVNYSKPLKRQKFRLEKIPKDLHLWDKRDQREYVRTLYHKRKHGEWWIIGGRERYIPGSAWFYYNFFETEGGGLPEFRFEGVEFFLFWRMCERDPDCYGMNIIKPRRIGDTDKTLCLLLLYAMSVRKSKVGMQNITEGDAKKNFDRIIDAFELLPWFFRPVQSGESRPNKSLHLRVPSEQMTKSKIRQMKIDKKGYNRDKAGKGTGLRSLIDYESTKFKRYDGRKLNRYYLDEPGKMTEMDPVAQWGVVKRCLSLNNEMDIIGKGIFTTTVEDVVNSSTVQNMIDLWEKSNPDDRDKNGRTKNGLYRYFRSAAINGLRDEFGYPEKQKTIDFINNTIDGLRESKDYDGIVNFRRRHPLTINDALLIPSENCVLLPYLLDERMLHLRTGTDYEGRKRETVVRTGNLVFSGGLIGGKVDFVEDEKGKWKITSLPDEPNKVIYDGGVQKPNNFINYAMGVDPIEHNVSYQKRKKGKGNKSKRISDGAIVIQRKFDPMVDCEANGIRYDANGNITNPEDMKTDKLVAFYKDRPDNPYDFYLECLKAAIFFGTKAHIERQKPYVINTMNDNGFAHFIQLRPKEVENNPLAKSKSAPMGTDATKGVISLYVDLIRYYVKQRWMNIDFLELLDEMRMFDVDNRGECDGTVALGYCLMAASDKRLIKRVNADKSRFDNIKIKKYKKVRREYTRTVA